MDILDSVHGLIQIPERIKPIIDTPEFQRLRELKQLGVSCYVFPAATHTRFEHSIGVMHLAGKLLKGIRSRQPDLPITDSIMFCVGTAGLLHDIGHGPFSHVFDNEFMASFPNQQFEHEQMSVKIIKMLFDDLRNAKNYKITEEELELIQALVEPKTHQKVYAKYKQKGLGFLFEIIANKRADVDRMDYFLRDSKQTGVGVSFNMNSMEILMKNARVINDEICWRQKTSKELETMFRTRHELFKKVYSHKATKALEFMVVDILKYANHRYDIVGKTKNPKDYLKLKDNIISMIEMDDIIQDKDVMDTELAKAKELIDKLRRREKYKCCGDLLLSAKKLFIFNPSNDNEEKKDNEHPKIKYRDIGRRWKSEIYEMFEAQQLQNNDKKKILTKPKLEKDDVIVSLMSLSFGMETKHPMEQIKFYNAGNLNKCYPLRCEQVATMSGIFREVVFRVYVKKSEWISECKQVFQQFVKEKGLIHSDEDNEPVEILNIKQRNK